MYYFVIQLIFTAAFAYSNEIVKNQEQQKIFKQFNIFFLEQKYLFGFKFTIPCSIKKELLKYSEIKAAIC